MAPPIAFFGFNSWTWRLSTTLFGSLLVGLMYLVALRLRRDRFFAIVTALFICFDGLAFVESRTGVIDIIAIFFVALFYYVFLLHWQARTRAQWRTTLYVMAGVAGLAFGAKLTALAPLIVAAGLILARGISPYIAGVRAVAAAHRRTGPRRDDHVAQRGRPARGAALLRRRRSSRSRSSSRASRATRRSSTRTCTSSPGATRRSPGCPEPPKTLDVPVMHVGPLTVPNPVEAIDNIIQINAASLRYHAEECHSHPYSSLWLTWPIMEHPVLFYATVRAEQRAGGRDHRHGQPGDLVARHPRAPLLRLAGDARAELVAAARPAGRARLARGDDDHLPGRGPLPRPQQLQHVVHGGAVHRQVPHATVVAVRDRAHLSGDLVRRRVRRRRHLRRLW